MNTENVIEFIRRSSALGKGKIFDESEFYGDNKHDHEYVKKGIRMFYEDYPEAKT